MNIIETIENLLLKKNCESVTFGRTPNKGVFIAVRQGVPTGAGTDNSSLCIHQLADGKSGEMFQKIVNQVDFCEGMSVKEVSRKPHSENN